MGYDGIHALLLPVSFDEDQITVSSDIPELSNAYLVELGSRDLDLLIEI